MRLDRAIKSIGLHEVLISLHPEVEVPITINVARSADEAERQARGEDLTQPESGGVRRARGSGRGGRSRPEAVEAGRKPKAERPPQTMSERAPMAPFFFSCRGLTGA